MIVHIGMNQVQRERSMEFDREDIDSIDYHLVYLVVRMEPK